jgi:hypothetical protein
VEVTVLAVTRSSLVVESKGEMSVVVDGSSDEAQCAFVTRSEQSRAGLDVPVRRCNKSAGAPSPRISCKAWWVQRNFMRLSLSKAAHADMAGGRAVGNPGSFALFAKGGISRILMHTVAYPTLEPKERVQG